MTLKHQIAIEGNEIKNTNHISDNSMRKREAAYKNLFRRFIFYTMICSVVPILLVGWGINIHYTIFAKSRMMRTFITQVDYHRKIIQIFLEERSSKLQLIAGTHEMDDLISGTRLNDVFNMININYWSITDLGVIDDQGNHLKYIGPYDLIDKNYSEALWFKEVMSKGIYISDMFTGFRQEPHFIIAVANIENGKKWILRATIDTDYFRSLVENVKIGQTGEVYLINKEGIFQTSPRLNGKIMEKAPFSVPSMHDGIVVRVLESRTDEHNRKTPSKIVSQAWLKEPHWMLMVQQDYSEAFNDVNYANKVTIIFLHLMVITILIVTILMTRHMISIIKKRDIETDQLNNQLMQAGKLASIGELSAGVAHQINNPLAIILTEKQILLDSFSNKSIISPELKKQFLNSMSQIKLQVKRCKHITQNLLRFARRTESVIETVDINEFLREVIELMERETSTSGIEFVTDLEEGLSSILSDPSQLQQVFLNLITNAIDAHDKKPHGMIHITTKSDLNDQGIWLNIKDNGVGIPKKNMQKIFDPFFTTKPVGKGTGLGLSICYSTIKRLGGNISVQSELNTGTQFTIYLPTKPPDDLMGSISV